MVLFSVVDSVHEWLKKRSETDINYRRVAGHFRSGEMGYCERQVYQTFNMPETFDLSRQGVFAAGNWIEDFIKTVIQWKAKELEVDYVIPQRNITWSIDWEMDTDVRGKADFLIMLKERTGAETQLIEVKSAYSIDHIDAPLKHHVTQVMPYIKTLEPTSTLIVYVDKNNFSKVKEFRIEYNEDIMFYIHEKAKRMHAYQRAGEIPFAEAKYCPKCKVGKLKVDHTTRPKSATCQPPGCGAIHRLDETNLWQCNYCPVKEWCDRLEAEREKQKTVKLEVPKNE